MRFQHFPSMRLVPSVIRIFLYFLLPYYIDPSKFLSGVYLSPQQRSIFPFFLQKQICPFTENERMSQRRGTTEASKFQNIYSELCVYLYLPRRTWLFICLHFPVPQTFTFLLAATLVFFFLPFILIPNFLGRTHMRSSYIGLLILKRKRGRQYVVPVRSALRIIIRFPRLVGVSNEPPEYARM